MAYRFAVSIASDTTVRCIVNAGRWPARGPAARAGWFSGTVHHDLAKLSDVDYLSSGSDTPAHARYEGLIAEGVTTFQSVSFWPWAGSEEVPVAGASLRVLDSAGLLDALALADVNGADVVVRQAEQGGTAASSLPVGRYRLERVEVLDNLTKALTLRGSRATLDEPITRAVFMPNVPALAWSSVPVVIGAVGSVPALPVNSDGTVSWLCDTPVAELGAVLDRGDAMEPGTFELAPDSQQLIMVSPPVGPVVCDVSSVGPDMQPATLVQALREIFRRADEGAWSLEDAAAIDAATGYAGIGYYTRESVSVREVLSAILPSYGAWWWEDAEGVLRFSRVTDPAAHVGDLAFDLSEDDLEGDLVVTPDLAPNLTRRMAYRPNAQALGAGDFVTDLVDVPASRRAELSSLYRGQVYSALPLAPQYAHADAADPFSSVFWRKEDAQAEIDRVVGLYAVPRMVCQVRARDVDLSISPGQVGKFTHSRYGLHAGRLMIVRSLPRNPVTGEISMVLWG
ncbi:hypothetical protein LJR143_002174 [Pseudoxanthomonas sp. LjRoot143]|uniref:hypothetical protein n=1 Tax=Pseudoxanthomonas sp. LjRoot143 TaxID=3342266 RepID=UPI003ED04EA6